MSSTSCDIYFDNNPSRVYYSGQLLSGRVVLKLLNEKTVRGIYVKIIGKGYCEWATGLNRNRKTCIGEEYYLNKKTFFVGGESGEIVILPGEYNYTFSCLLSVQLPTSVEATIGYIRYSVVVCLDCPMGPHQEYDEFFTVLRPRNLNDNTALLYPVSKELRKTFFICCLLCCCETDPVIMNARIPVGGFTPGQAIELSLNIDNKSDQTFECFQIRFIKHIQYYTHALSDRTTFEDVELAEESSGGCVSNESNAYMVHITVPPVPPTDVFSSNIIKVTYVLRITGLADLCRKNPVVDIPITIGTYPILLRNILGDNTGITQQPRPLASCPSQNYGEPSFLPSPIESNEQHASAPPFESIEGIDPPTYEEALALAGLSANADGKSFQPLYPVYRRTPSYTTNTNQ